MEGCSLDVYPEPGTQEVLPDLEVGDLLDRVAAALSETERRMLALIRSGHSLAESARLLGIPRGSRAYYQGRLVACAEASWPEGWSCQSADQLLKFRGTPLRKTGH